MPEEDYDIVRAKDDFPANLEFSLKKKKNASSLRPWKGGTLFAIYHNLIKSDTHYLSHILFLRIKSQVLCTRGIA